jgi:serine-type D-Ala-D-Ala carboxypeptidase (penicillin-binding protein 5/6)
VVAAVPTEPPGDGINRPADPPADGPADGITPADGAAESGATVPPSSDVVGPDLTAAVVAAQAAEVMATAHGSAGGAAAESDTGASPGAPASHRHTRRSKHHPWRWTVAVVVIVLLVGALVGAARINQPMARPVLVSSMAPTLSVPGTHPVLPWPVVGQGAISVPSIGYADQSGPESAVPIASLTKMTTAVVILRDHPLALGASGPTITITPGMAAQFDVDLDNDESNIPLQAGEHLTEYQMLEAMMNQSANDVAWSLAVWDAGSLPAFVAKMNALAVSLGAKQTHYVDASGFDPQSVSTASDVLRIAAAGMAIPAFANVVDKPTVTLPLVGTVNNIVTQIGSDGVVGIKSGYTSQAGACMVLAGYRVIGGRSVLVLASALGQHVPPPAKPKPGHPATTTGISSAQLGMELEYPLHYAGPLVEKLLDASEASVTSVTVARPGQVLGSASVHWGGSDHAVGAEATGGAWLAAWPGQKVAAAVKAERMAAGAKAGSRAGDALFALGHQIAAVPLRTTATVPEPTWPWRLLHG